MTSNANPARSRPGLWLVKWGIPAAIIGLATFTGFWGCPSWRDTEYRSALAAAQQDSFTDAEPRLRRILDRRPDDVAIIRALSLGYLTVHRFDEAEPLLDRWHELSPREAEPLQRRMELWMQKQQTAPAVDDVKRILQLKPDDRRGRQILAQLLFIEGRFDEAEREADQCFQAEPNNRETMYLLASIYQRQGRSGKATEMVDRILGAKPNAGPALALKANLLLESGQADSAIQILARVAASPAQDLSFGAYPITREWANVIQNLSYIQDRPLSLHRDGQPSPNTRMLAEQSLDRSVILFQLSEALARAGRAKESKLVLAEMQLRRALNLWNTDKLRDVTASLQGEVVHAYLDAGKTDEAIKFLTDILGRHPDGAGTHMLLAECYDKRGQTELAAEQRRLGSQGK
jgi:predicted Zn-dependent protease